MECGNCFSREEGKGNGVRGASLSVGSLAQLPWGWTKDDATRIRFCYAKSRSLRKQNWLELRSNSESVWQLGKAINGMSLRVLSEDEVAYVVSVVG